MKRMNLSQSAGSDAALAFLAGLLLVSAAGGCADAITGQGDAEFTILLTTQLTHEMVEYSCTVTGRLNAREPFPTEWSGPVDFLVTRRAVGSGSMVAADTLLKAERTSIKLHGDSKASIDLPSGLGGPLFGNVQEFWVDEVVAAGPWSCPGDFPLGHRAELVHPLENPPWGLTGRWALYRTQSH